VTSHLAERFGLRVYSSDLTIGVHAARLDAATAPLLDHFRRMSMDQRWVLRAPAIMYKTFPWFQGEGFDLLLEDLRSLPANQVILVEGFRLLPHLVQPYLSDPRHAVWLIPTPEFLRAAFAAREDAEAFWLRTTDPASALAKLLQRDEIFADDVAAAVERNQALRRRGPASGARPRVDPRRGRGHRRAVPRSAVAQAVAGREWRRLVVCARLSAPS